MAHLVYSSDSKSDIGVVMQDAPYRVELIAIPGIHLIKSGNNIAKEIADALLNSGLTLADHDILVIASKIISKAEGRTISLISVIPSEYAKTIAEKNGKDPRLVEVILQEGSVMHVEKGVIETRHRLGFACTSACVDRANVDSEKELVSLLPLDTDASADRIRNDLLKLTGKNVGIIINDSFGIKYRAGSVGLAVGVSGVPAIISKEDQTDLYGNKRRCVISFADEIAAMGSALMGQGTEARPVVIVRGLKCESKNGRLADLVSKDQLERDAEIARNKEK